LIGNPPITRSERTGRGEQSPESVRAPGFDIRHVGVKTPEALVDAMVGRGGDGTRLFDQRFDRPFRVDAERVEAYRGRTAYRRKTGFVGFDNRDVDEAGEHAAEIAASKPVP
jgi:hypothetical protein